MRNRAGTWRTLWTGRNPARPCGASRPRGCSGSGRFSGSAVRCGTPPTKGPDMITKFSTVYAGHVDLGDMGQQATPANERRYSERAPGLRLREDGGHRPVHGRARLPHPLAGRAPLPARGLRVHPQHPDGRRAPRPPDVAAAHRVRLQHRAHVAPAPAGRGLRHRRHPHRRAHRLRRGPRLPHPRGRDLRRADARRRGQPRSVRGAGRHRHEGLQLGVLLAPGQALHAAARRALSRLRAEGAHPGAAAAPPAGRVLAADRERRRPRPRLHDEAPHQGADRRRRGHHGGEVDLRLPGGRRARRPRLQARRGPEPRHLLPPGRLARAGRPRDHAVVRGARQDVRAAGLRARHHAGPARGVHASAAAGTRPASRPSRTT